MDNAPYDMPKDAVQITGAKLTPIALERVDGSAVDGYIVLTRSSTTPSAPRARAAARGHCT
jgi:hypothetical protein